MVSGGHGNPSVLLGSSPMWLHAENVESNRLQCGVGGDQSTESC